MGPRFFLQKYSKSPLKNGSGKVLSSLGIIFVLFEDFFVYFGGGGVTEGEVLNFFEGFLFF
jgi:hypothetical protein